MYEKAILIKQIKQKIYTHKETLSKKFLVN